MFLCIQTCFPQNCQSRPISILLTYFQIFSSLPYHIVQWITLFKDLIKLFQLILLRRLKKYTSQKNNVELTLPSWTPSWISKPAVTILNLCWQYDKLQTLANFLVYNIACSTFRVTSSLLRPWLKITLP